MELVYRYNSQLYPLYGTIYFNLSVQIGLSTFFNGYLYEAFFVFFSQDSQSFQYLYSFIWW